MVFDAVGGGALRRSWAACLKPNGRMVTIATNGGSSEDKRVKSAFFIVEANRQQLEEVARSGCRRAADVCRRGGAVLESAGSVYGGYS